MNSQQLEAQQKANYRRLRFLPDLEAAFRDMLNQSLKKRARPVAASALAIFLIYAALDPVLLPASLAPQTVLLRLAVICPMIALVWGLSFSRLHPHLFARWYVASYMWGGFGIVAIIALARQQQVPMPYDGILLMLMFGYILMGMPFRPAAISSLVISISYLLTEVAYGTPPETIGINCFFIVTANIIGMISSWLGEYRQRAHFLDRRMLEFLHEKAETDSAEKTHLISVASHDLRQPLNVINLLLENLAATELQSTQRRLVSRLLQSVGHFNGLLGSLLDISRIQENMIRPIPETLAVNDVIGNVVDACDADARGASVNLRAELGPQNLTVNADPHLLHRILQNLVINAISHSHCSRLTLRVVGNGFGQTCFSVHDDGCGLDETERSRVFESFYRGDRSNGSNPGLGLGLAIVRELTELMAGNCGVESTPGAGSEFWVSLPGHYSASQPAPPIALPKAAKDASTILLAFADEEVRNEINTMLSRWGHKVVAAGSIKAALATSLSLDPALDVLIGDMHLPDGSGRELFDRLQQGSIVVGGILLTADTEQTQQFYAAENLWIMHKPLVPARLRTALLRLGSRRV